MNTTTNQPGFIPGAPAAPIASKTGSMLDFPEHYFPAQVAARDAAVAARGGNAPAPAAAVAAVAAAGLAAPATVKTSPAANVADAGVTTDAEAVRRAAVDDVMAALIASNADLSSPTGHREPNYIYESSTGTVTLTDAGQATPPGAEAARVFDDGRNLQAEHTSLLKIVTDLENKLNAGVYDATTGKLTYDVTSQAREVLERQIESTKASVSLSIQALNAIAQQRHADELKAQANSNEQIARAAYSNGNKDKAELLNKMIAEEEARALAQSIVRARTVGRR